MAETIKIFGTDDAGVDYAIENLADQLEHKENTLKKEGGYSGIVEVGSVKLTFVNGQLTEVEE